MPADAAIDALLEGLNPPQRDAVTHGEGPLLILAGAGSGKTRVLTHRIAYLMRTGQARPSEILAITFTNKAAAEMRERVELLVGRATRAMWVMTFHSACARMLRADADKLGYTRQFTIYDSADQRRLIKRCLDDLDIDVKRFTPRAMQSQISDAKNKLRSVEDYRQLVGSFFEQTVADVYEQYERQLHRANAMDFDDLLVRSVNLLELFQEVRDRYASSFRWVMVDEYQDTNHVQYRWLQLLTSEHRNLAVVGDDDSASSRARRSRWPTARAGRSRTIGVGRRGALRLWERATSGRPRSLTRIGLDGPMASRSRRERARDRQHARAHAFRRLSLGLTPPLYMTYLMRRRDMGCRVGTTRTQTTRPRSRRRCAARAITETAEAAWVVSTHETEAEARARRPLLLALRLPTSRSTPRSRDSARMSRSRS